MELLFMLAFGIVAFMILRKALFPRSIASQLRGQLQELQELTKEFGPAGWHWRLGRESGCKHSVCHWLCQCE